MLMLPYGRRFAHARHLKSHGGVKVFLEGVSGLGANTLSLYYVAYLDQITKITTCSVCFLFAPIICMKIYNYGTQIIQTCNFLQRNSFNEPTLMFSTTFNLKNNNLINVLETYR